MRGELRLVVRTSALGMALALAWVPSAGADTFRVTTTDDAGAGSLRKAITKANSDPDKDSIEVATTGSVRLQSALPDLSTDMDITGTGSQSFKVRRKAGGDYRIFHVLPDASVKISKLTATNGSVVGEEVAGGGILNEGDLRLRRVAVTKNSLSATSNFIAVADGGGISNEGELNVSRSVVSGNAATVTTQSSFNAFGAARGGGINSTGPLLITKSTLAANQVTGSSPSQQLNGGGLFSDSEARVSRSTVSDNRVETGASGGIENRTPGTMTLTNSTVTQNVAQFAGGVDNQQGTLSVASTTISANSSSQAGANLTNADGGTLNLLNTIVADPAGGALDCSVFSTFNDEGFNLDTDASCPFTQPSSQSSADPMLGPLQDNGGATLTRALGDNSDAIDQGDSEGLITDQRGRLRPIDFAGPNAPGGDGTDVGAFERQNP